MKSGFITHFLVLALGALLIGCSGAAPFVLPREWSDPIRKDSAIIAFTSYCNGKTVFLDPGHGGESAAAVSPNKSLKESEINLRIALKLREFLKKAGATVLMSREAEVSVPLEARAHQANVNKADLFVSIHQNSTTDPSVNYTTVVYHSQPGRRGFQPSSQDLARYIQRDLSYAMRTPGSLASFDGTLSDFLLAPDKGFAVLREANMTAVLVECGFLSHPEEEERLGLPEFNEVQAWGIFQGIAKYLQAGIPTLTYVSSPWFKEARPKMELLASDPAGIKDESIKVEINGREQGFSFNAKTGRITILPSEELSEGYHLLSAQVRNIQDNSSSPFSTYFAVGIRPTSLKQSTDPAEIPADPRAISVITITAHDSSGAMLGSGLPIRFTTSTGLDTLLTTKDGKAQALITPSGADRVSFEASNGPIQTQGSITVSKEAQYTRGVIMGADGKPLSGASITLPGRSVFSVNRSGEYIVSGVKPEGLEVTVSAPGYFTRKEAFTKEIVQDPMVLSPVAAGVLHNKTILLARTPGQRGIALDTLLEARTLEILAELLHRSGATPLALPPPEGKRGPRQAMLSAHPQALMVQVQFPRKATKAVLRFSPAWNIADPSTAGFLLHSGIPAQKTTLTSGLLFEAPKAALCSAIIPAGTESTEAMASRTAWGLYGALLAKEGFKASGTRTILVQVVDKVTRKPVPQVAVELNGTLRSLTNAKGVCVFHQVSTSDDDVRLLEPEKYEIQNVNTEVAR